MMKRKRKSRSRVSSKKPFGFVKTKSGYALVFGSRAKPRLGKSRYGSKKALASAVRRKYMKKR